MQNKLWLFILISTIFTGCSNDGSDSVVENTGSNEVAVNGCTSDIAIDLTGQQNVTITDHSSWLVGHGACVLVEPGTKVTWEGNFNIHPLIGGSPGQVEATNPVTLGSPQTGSNPITIDFPSSGTFGYFCTIHTTSMQGVVYVQ